jgi:putative flippase GtrA
VTIHSRDRQAAGPRTRRPAVVEPVDSPQSTSDGRTTSQGRFASSVSAARPPRAQTPADGVFPRRGIGSQIRRFAAIGIVSMLAWAGLYSLLRGAGLGSVAANGLALVVTAIGNTAANRRLTFGVTGRRGLARDHGAGLLAFAVAIGITTASAAALDLLAPHAGRLVELAVLTVANAIATGGRFVLLRTWVGRPASVRAADWLPFRG